VTTPIGDAAAAATRFTARRNRRTAPQPVLAAPARPALPAPEPPAQEETMSPVAAALAAVQHQAAALERDVTANPLAVVITARHVGKAFTAAECIAVADFIAAVEAERRTQDGSQPRTAAAPAANGSGSPASGPQRIMQ